MGVSVKLVLDERKVRRDGCAPVHVRIIADRRPKYRSTGVHVRPRDWNADKQTVRRTHPLADAYNARLGDLKLAALEAALRGGTAEQVKARLVGETGSLSAFFERFVADLDAAARVWDAKKYRTTQRKLAEVLGTPRAPARDVPFAAVDRHALVRFERYLRETLGNGPNTVVKEMQRLRRVFHAAVRSGAIRAADDPFAAYDRPRGEKPDRLKLAAADVLAIAAVETGNERLRLARDAFAFAFYGGGIRFSDVATLRPEHVVRPADAGGSHRLRYRMQKTGTLVDLPLPPPAVGIAERYRPTRTPARPFVFPMLQAGDDADPVRLRRRVASWNAMVNERLKTLAESASVEDAGRVSFHAARHAYAVFAASKSGDVYAISKALGHGSLAVTQAYLKSFDRDATDRLSEALWS